MGCFDTVLVPCPECGEEVGFQSKSGPCELAVFPLNHCPPSVMKDVNRHSPHRCPKCATRFSVLIDQKRSVEIPDISADLVKWTEMADRLAVIVGYIGTCEAGDGETMDEADAVLAAYRKLKAKSTLPI
jgi:hypothetical protein